MIIPYQELSVDTLNSLIEAFITREGTDYGVNEISLDVKVNQVRRQIEKGDVVIVYDQASETVSLLTRRDAALLDQHDDA